MTAVVPLWAAASQGGVKVTPGDLSASEVAHYAIDELGITGAPRLQPPSEILSDKLMVSTGDLLVSRLNPRRGHIFRVTPHDVPALASGEFAVVRPNSRMDKRFVWYVLNSQRTRTLLDEQVRSVTKSHGRVEFDAIWKLPMPVPPVGVQRRIADYLDTETARIDVLRNKNERAAALVQERLAANVSSSFGGAVRETDAGVPVGIEGITCAPLYSVAEVQSGLTLNAANEVDGAPSWAYLRVANVQDGHLALDTIKTVNVPRDTAARHLLRPGDVLMTEGGDPDKLGRGTVFRGEVQNCLHQNHVFAVRPDPSRLLPDYLALATRSPYGRMYFEKTSSKTTGIASTSATKIGAWRVPLPTLEAQQAVVETIHKATDLTSSTLARLGEQAELLRERHQALITAAVTGEIEV